MYCSSLSILQLEYQRQQLLQERQQFHLEQIRAAEYRARQIAMTQLASEQRQQPHAASPDQGGCVCLVCMFGFFVCFLFGWLVGLDPYAALIRFVYFFCRSLPPRWPSG